VKRRVVSVFLVLFALWPLAHYSLTERFGSDPWKLFGWAMYCVPGPMKTVRIMAVGEGGRVKRLDFRDYRPMEQVLVDTFRTRRHALGELASPDALAAGLLALHPDFAGVLVAVLTLEMDRESARLMRSIDHSTHWRDGRDQDIHMTGKALEELFGP